MKTQQQQLDTASAEATEVIQMWASGLVTLPELIGKLLEVKAQIPADLSGLICPTTGLRLS